MKAHRTKRIAGTAALLAALALTASGCSVASAQSAPQGTPSPTATAGKRLADIATANADSDFEGWNTGDGTPFKWSEADKKSMEKNGLAILQVLIEDHPEFTVEGFKPTLEIWDKEVAPKLKPLTLSTAWPQLTADWMRETPAEDGRFEDMDARFPHNPILTNRPELLNGDKYPGYDVIRSWKSDKGEKCSPSDQPYATDVKGISITTRVDAAADASSAFPLLTASYDVTVHCKEGGAMTVPQISTTVQLKKEHGEWLLGGTNTFTAKSHGPMVIQK
jgi:hypothetical protein